MVMLRFLLFFILLACGFGQSVFAQAPVIPPPQPDYAGRSFARVTPRYYSTMDGQFGAAGNAQQMVTHGSVTSGTPTWTLDTPQQITTNVTTTAGGYTITTSTSWCSASWYGQLISITGAGSSGGTLNAHILSCGTGTTINLDTPAGVTLSASSQTVTYGPVFTAADVGKAIVIGNVFNFNQPYVSTISSVSCTIGTSCSITTASSSGFNSAGSSNPETIFWGTDDSTAISSACQAAVSRGDFYLTVPAVHFVTTMNASCLNVHLRGEGSILSSGMLRGIQGGDSDPWHWPVYVTPPWAGPASPPPSTINGYAQLPHLRACGTSCVVAHMGDSLETLNPMIANSMQSIISMLDKKIQDDNPGVNFTFNYCGVGAQTAVNMNTTTTTNTAPPCVTNTTTKWLGSAASPGFVYNLNPDLITIGFGNNDGWGLSFSALANIYATIQNWAKVPDLIFLTHYGYSYAGNNAGFFDQDSFAAQMIRGFAHVHNIPLLDINAQGEKVRSGYDPTRMALIKRQDVVSSGSLGNLSNRYQFPLETTGYSITLTLNGNGSTMWSTYGNELKFAVGARDHTWTNIVHVGYDTASTHIYVQCDVDANYVGVGCKGGSNPSIITSVTTSGTTITTTDGVFAGHVSGDYICIPNAGTGGNTAFCTTLNGNPASSTSATLAATPTTTLTSASEALIFGNPKIISSFSPGASGNDTMEFTVTNDSLFVNYNGFSANQVIYSGPIMRYGGLFTPMIISASGSGGATVSNDGVSGSKSWLFFTEMPVLNQPTLREQEVQGPESNPFGNTGYFGPCGGDGTNHGTCWAATDIIYPVISANNFSVGPVGSRRRLRNITTGTTDTMVSADEIINWNSSSSSAKTETLLTCNASNKGLQYIVKDGKGDGATNNITLSAPSGTTIDGTSSKVINTNSGFVRMSCDGVSNWLSD